MKGGEKSDARSPAGAPEARRGRAGARRPRFLNEKQLETLEALVARVIPSGGSPGAREAGVSWYIDWRLSIAPSLDRLEYKEGLANVEKLSRSMFGRKFAEASEAEQDSLLGELESGSVSGWTGSAAFFATLRTHTAEGFLCDPKYGGNREFVGWKAVGAGGDPEPEGYTAEEIRDASEVEPFYTRRIQKADVEGQRS